MVNYAYSKKLKQNVNLPVAIIDFLSNFVEATYFRLKNGDIRVTQIREGQNICCQKSIFQLNWLSIQLFSWFR